MISRQAKLDQKQIEQLSHIDRSIQHWSVEHTKLQIQAQGLLNQVEGLFQARQQLLEGAYKDAGINPGSVVQSRINAKDGVVHLICNEEPAPGQNGTAGSASPEAPAGNSSSAPTDPPADAPTDPPEAKTDTPNS